MNRNICAVWFPLLFVATSPGLALAGSLEDLPDPGLTELDTPTVRIEMNLESGRPMIELRVNGEGPFQFVVDTGAGLSVIDEGIAKKLGLEVVGKQVLQSPGASVDIEGERVQAGRLEVGELRIEKPVLATMDLVGFSAGTIEGVLGRPHFRDFLMTFDYPGSQLLVARGNLDESDSAVLSFDDQAGSIRFPIDVSGVTVPMVLDTGSPGGFTLPKALESRFKFHSALQQGPTIRLVGGAHPTWRASLDGTVRLGNVTYRDPEVILTTIADEFGNIGFNVLRELRVTLDQANGLVRFERVAAVEQLPGPNSGQAIRRGGPVSLGGASDKPRMGVAFEMTPAGFIKKSGGLVVRHVDAGGPGDRAGLKVADIVLSVGGTAVAEIEGVMAIGKLLQGPRPLNMELQRGDERLTIIVN